MFKIGTEIEIINAGDGAHGADGNFGIVTDDSSHSGLADESTGFNVKLKNGKIWRVSIDGCYKIIPQNTKELLETGMVVEIEDGSFMMCIVGNFDTVNYDKQSIMFIDTDCIMLGSSYDSDLNYITTDDWDENYNIVAIYKSPIRGLNNILKHKEDFKLVWKREEKSPQQIEKEQIEAEIERLQSRLKELDV